MDRISQLCDELLLNILSLLPTANEVVATMILSKRWQFLWTMVPKLVYDDGIENIEFARFSRFVDRSLFLHEAPVIDTLHFKLGKTCGTGDIRVWIRAAEKLNVGKLIFELYTYPSSQVSLPSSFFKGCRMLVKLTLRYAILVDVSYPISFPSLKELGLSFVKYPGDEFFNMFLSKCHVLEDLDLERFRDDNLSICTIRVPSLKILSVRNEIYNNDGHGLVIDAPSLERLEITDYTEGFCVIENEMPRIVSVDVTITRRNLGNILGTGTSFKSLRLCLSFTVEDAYPVGSVFHQLVSLELCRCYEHWLNLLMRFLEGSPRLRSLTLDHCLHTQHAFEWNRCWSLVSDCLLSSLETLEWTYYKREEKELAKYILRNGACLKKVTISFKTSDINKKLEMIKVLTMSFKRSPNCQLVFN